MLLVNLRLSSSMKLFLIEIFGPGYVVPLDLAIERLMICTEW